MNENRPQVVQRKRCKVTTQRGHFHAIAENYLHQQFNPAWVNQVWSTDITYLRTAEGWLYLAIVMDLHLRRIVGWAIDRRMTQALITRADDGCWAAQPRRRFTASPGVGALGAVIAVVNTRASVIENCWPSTA